MNASRDGRRIAVLFRQACDLGDVRQCDLHALLARDDIDLVEAEAEQLGFDAVLLRAGSGGGIMVPRGQDPGRRRFSIAHELGHFHIPSHVRENHQGPCFDADLRARMQDAAKREWEANDFAAELLMPYRLFAEDVSKLVPSIEDAALLAAPDMYNVSLFAAAWRLVQTTREAAALVVSANGRVSWIVKSDAFRVWLTERNQLLHPDTIAASVFRGEGPAEKPTEVNMGAWLEQATRPLGQLLESAYLIGATSQVVSLLWHVNDGAADDDN